MTKQEKPFHIYNPVTQELENTNDPNWYSNKKKIFPEQPIKKMADKIVDKNYLQNKSKSPFTQVAENAVKELSFKMKDGFIENNAGNHRLNNVKEAIELNEALDKNFRDHKEDDYLKKLKHFGVENSQIKQEGYPKAVPKPRLANVPILQRNINNRKPTPPKTNATIERYKNFKEEKKFKEEEKKFNAEFDKEYSDAAMEKYVRGKVNKNISAGKAPYEDLPSSYLIVGEHAKDKAKKQLAEIKIEHVKLAPSYIDYRLNLEDTGPTISLEEHMAKTAPREIDAGGITALDGVKNFRNVVDTTHHKFPTKARGIGPYISGEDDAK